MNVKFISLRGCEILSPKKSDKRSEVLSVVSRKPKANLRKFRHFYLSQHLNVNVGLSMTGPHLECELNFSKSVGCICLDLSYYFHILSYKLGPFLHSINVLN